MTEYVAYYYGVQAAVGATQAVFAATPGSATAVVVYKAAEKGAFHALRNPAGALVFVNALWTTAYKGVPLQVSKYFSMSLKGVGMLDFLKKGVDPKYSKYTRAIWLNIMTRAQIELDKNVVANRRGLKFIVSAGKKALTKINAATKIDAVT